MKGVPRLNALYQKYQLELQILGIAADSADRLLRFQAAAPAAYPLLVDSDRSIARLYPRQMLPYTVVLDARQRVVAITTPAYLTEELLAGRPVALPKPGKSLRGKEEPPVPVSDKPVAVFKSWVPGGSSAQAGKGEYQGRRWTYVNMTLDLTGILMA